MYRWFFSLLLLVGLPVTGWTEGHYAAGVYGIRDFSAVPKGWYLQHYNVYYSSDRFKDRDGDSVKSVTVRGVTADVDLEVEVVSFAPNFFYMSDLELLGAKLGFFTGFSLANTDINASVSTAGQGLEIDDSSFGFGDPFFQPLYMVWETELADYTFGYFFYAPLGEFDSDANDNIGLGYWSNNFQASATWFLDETKATAFSLFGTFEIHGEQEDSDFQPGNIVALEWGISQYLSERLEVGVTGYHYWQVSDDKGVEGPIRLGRERVHGIGGQVGYWALEEELQFSLRFLTEVGARSRFEGNLGVMEVIWVL